MIRISAVKERERERIKIKAKQTDEINIIFDLLLICVELLGFAKSERDKARTDSLIQAADRSQRNIHAERENQSKKLLRRQRRRRRNCCVVFAASTQKSDSENIGNDVVIFDGLAVYTQIFIWSHIFGGSFGQTE